MKWTDIRLSTYLIMLLYKGPKLHMRTFQNLIRFRFLKVALVSDIQKTYHQIHISDVKTLLQRSSWESNPWHPLLVYRVTTHTYGIASLPILVLSTIRQLWINELQNFAVALVVTSTHMCVNDFLGDTQSTETYINLISDYFKCF